MITFYSKEGCPWCDDARTYLQKNNLEFQEKEVRGNKEYFDEMVAVSGQSKAPTFVIDGIVLADSSDTELAKYLSNTDS